MARKRTVIGTLFAANPLVAAGVIVGAGVLGYFGLKKLFAPSDRPPRIRGGRGRGIPKGWSPYPLATRLKTEMSGISLGTYPSAWRTLAELPTDDMVVAVYRAFNEQYYDLGDGTLTEWIMDEWQLVGTTKSMVLARLRSLQLP